LETIKEFIARTEATGHERRIERLTALRAPEIVIEQERRLLALKNTRNIKVGAKKPESAEELMAREFTYHEIKTGNGGKPYILFTTAQGPVSYFPMAQHGPFISGGQR